MKFTDEQIQIVMRGLGVTKEHIQTALEDEKACKELKLRVKKAFRKFALKHHPDRSDAPESKALFQLATQVLDEINDLRPEPKREVIQRWVYHVHSTVRG